MAAKFDPKAKAKKQKIVAAVLGVVLLGVLAWQVPSVLKMMNKKPPASTAPVPAAPGPGAPVPPATGAAPTGVATAVSNGTLADSDPAAQPAGGQLVSFDRFASKDPFAQQLGTRAAPKSSRRASAPKPAPPAPPPPAAAAKSPAAAATSARISVNGAGEQVAVGGSFPQADPLFVLVAVTGTTAKVRLADGTLDSGAATVTLRKGKKLTLQNTVDGARYELLLISTS